MPVRIILEGEFVKSMKGSLVNITTNKSTLRSYLKFLKKLMRRSKRENSLPLTGKREMITL